MNKLVMFDIETTGLDIDKEDILQVSYMLLEKKEDLWSPRASSTTWQHTDRQPESDFAKKYQTELYKRANEATPMTAEEVRKEALLTFRIWNLQPKDVVLTGLSIGNFDIPFVRRFNYLTAEDHSHRIYDINSILSFAKDKLNLTDAQHSEFKTAMKKLGAAVSPWEMPQSVKETKSHDALRDCYDQTHILNGLLTFFK
jgi:oligoribonuclease (3'-5' exoribonuclease)